MRAPGSLSRRLGLNALGVVLVLAVGGVGVFVLWPAWRRAADDPPYAAQVFDGLVSYDRVLASRRWHRFGADAWDCTYAIVDLAETAPDLPPRRDGDTTGWEFVWGGDWQPTPAEPLGDTTRDAVGTCAERLGAGTSARLETALSEPGSWYVRDSVGETVHVYSAAQRLAARIRYGD
jgi:hypothetical protein